MDKKLLFRTGFSALVVILSLNVSAAVHEVHVSNFQFSPNTINVLLGDVVRFIWMNGGHTTTSVSVPSGAATWNSPMNSTVTTFDYTVTHLGTYNYVCTPHSGSMTGTFTASGTIGIDDNASSYTATSLYPNPFTNELFVEQGNENPEYSELIISDILGKQLRIASIENLPMLSGKRRIDVGDLSKGIYFVTLKGNGTKARTIRLVKEGA